jgi:DNA mismatch endonuclease, patch repair protein
LGDIFSKDKRSKIMSNISGKETKPEILVRKYLFGKGFRYRKNVKELTGKPDIVLKKYNTIIFVHGCFWHGHDCSKAKIPTTNKEFWIKKISSNIKRDKQNIKTLQKESWKVIIIWQCQLKNNSVIKQTLTALSQQIKSNTYD